MLTDHFEVNTAGSMIEEKPYAPSCDKNSQPILGVLKSLVTNHKSLLEIGSGTGQHAIFMAPYLPNLTWTLSDVADRIPGISLWLRDYPRSNLRGPLEYEVGKTSFPEGEYDVVFTSNTLHIMSWEKCLLFFRDLGQNLKSDSLFIVYGAFNYGGKFTSESNQKFEAWLKNLNQESGIRNFEDVCDNLKAYGFDFFDDIEMPANNRILVFKKS